MYSRLQVFHRYINAHYSLLLRYFEVLPGKISLKYKDIDGPTGLPIGTARCTVSVRPDRIYDAKDLFDITIVLLVLLKQLGQGPMKLLQ